MLKVHLDPYMRNEIVLFYTSYCSSNRSNSCLSLLYQYFLKKERGYIHCGIYPRLILFWFM